MMRNSYDIMKLIYNTCTQHDNYSYTTLELMVL